MSARNTMSMTMSMSMTKIWLPDDISILYHCMCKHFIVVNKPYDLKINSNDVSEITLETLLKERGIKSGDSSSKKPSHSFYYIHRLDYATSGTIYLGLTKYAAQQASLAFSSGTVKKYYLALLRGHVDSTLVFKHKWLHTKKETVGGFPCIDINCGLIQDRSTDFPFYFRPYETEDNTNCLASKPADGQCIGSDKVVQAYTRLCILQSGTYNGAPATKVLLIPKTGRSHQLRVHCKYIGHVIVGDYTYSNRQDTSPYRMMLHSYTMSIPTPPFDSIHMKSPDPFINDSQWLVDKTFHNPDDIIASIT